MASPESSVVVADGIKIVLRLALIYVVFHFE